MRPSCLGDRHREAGFLASIFTRPKLTVKCLLCGRERVLEPEFTGSWTKAAAAFDIQEALTELEAAVLEDRRALRIYRLETERPVDVPDTSRQRLAREEWG